MRTDSTLAFCGPVLRCVLGAALLFGSSAGCSHTKLDDSFGVRNREIFRVQVASRPSRDIVQSGQSAESAMAKLNQRLAPQENGGGGAAQASAGASPLKIPGLSR